MLKIVHRRSGDDSYKLYINILLRAINLWTHLSLQKTMANLLSNAIKRTIGKREALFDVSALNPYVHEWKIKVKIIRKFRRSYPSYETMDLILVDVKVTSKLLFFITYAVNVFQHVSM